MHAVAYLVGRDLNHPGTADLVIVVIMTRVVGKTEGSSITAQVTSTYCQDRSSVVSEEAPHTLLTFSF